MAINKVVYGENTLIDLTDTTATADKILTGYGAYGADGVWMNGTATAGGSVTQDQDGFIVLPPDGGGGGGGGGLEYEEGVWTPSEDVARPTINFARTHSLPPMFVMMADATGTDEQTAPTNFGFSYSSFYSYTGQGVPSNETANRRYGLTGYVYRTATNPAQSITGVTTLGGGSSSSDTNYWVSETGFVPSSASTTRYWKMGRVYKWIAVWAPTT